MKTIYFFTDQKKYCGSEVMMTYILNDKLINTFYKTFLIYCDNKNYYDSVKDKIDRDKLLSFNKFRLTHKPNILLKFLDKYISFFINYYRLKSFLKDKKIDILHINNGGFPGAFTCNSLVLAAKKMKVNKIVYSVHNMAINYNRPSRFLDRFIDPLIVKNTSIFLTGSRSASDQLLKVLKSKNNIVINTGTNVPLINQSKKEILEKFNLEHSTKIILVPANFEKRKGHHILVESISILNNDIGLENLPYFIFAGDGLELNSIKSKVQKLKLETKVIFTGHLTDFYFPLLSISDIVILPSIANEDFPNVIMESMAYGKAIIATEIAGIPEQISHGISGLLVKPSNSNDLYQKIKYLLKNDQAINYLGSNAQKEYEKRFSLDITLSNYLSFYNSLE